MDQELIKFLRKSAKIVGHLEPVIRDKKGNIISGRHRKHADPNWPEKTVEVDDPLELEILAFHYNVQRKMPREETQQRLMRAARLMEAKGVKKDRISAELAKLVPYEPRYIQELLPDEYKMKSKARWKGEVVRQNGMACSRQDVLALKYLYLPLAPDKYQLVKRAISTAKRDWAAEDDGEALCRICKGYLEGKSG